MNDPTNKEDLINIIKKMYDTFTDDELYTYLGAKEYLRQGINISESESIIKFYRDKLSEEEKSNILYELIYVPTTGMFGDFEGGWGGFSWSSLLTWNKRTKLLKKYTKIGKDVFNRNKEEFQRLVCTSESISKYILSDKNKEIYGLISGIAIILSPKFEDVYALVAGSILIARSGIKIFCKNYISQ